MYGSAEAVSIAADEVLRILSEHEEPMTLHDLVEETGMRRGQVWSVLVLEEGITVRRVGGTTFSDDDIRWRAI